MSPSADNSVNMPSEQSPERIPSASRPSELPVLDLDELSPLPPAHAFSNSRSTSTERLPGLKRDAAPRVDLTEAAAPSPALSAAPSSFRLEGSPPTSLRPVDSPALAPLTGQQLNSNASADSHQSGEYRQHEDEEHQILPQQKQEMLAAAGSSARYVTVSAILSRSEMYYAPETSDHWDILRSPQGMPADAHQSQSPYPWLPGSSNPLGSVRRRKTQRKQPSNGSALEALGALLLRKDSSGRVASLSFARTDRDDSPSVDTSSKHADSLGRKDKFAPKQGVQAWASAFSSLGKKGLRLQLPQSGQPKASSSSKGGATIAERRAQMWHQMLTGQGAVVSDGRNGFNKVRSRRGGLSFEVGTTSRKQMPSTLLDLDNYKPSSHGKKTKSMQQDHNLDDSEKEPHLDEATVSSSNFGRIPDTIVLKAGRRPRLTQLSKSEFGIGSAYHDQILPEAPPSPIAMPGAWQGGSSWRSKPGDGYEEGALLLPPPLLDDHGSDAASFEGLLGVRRMREREKARKQAEKMAARNRPAHKVGPLTALTNFVKAAHAAETSAKRANAARRPPAFFRSNTEPAQMARSRSRSIGHLSQVQQAEAATSGELASMSTSGDGVVPQGENADASSKSARTETAAHNTAAAEADLRRSPLVTSASPYTSPATRRAALSRRGSRNGSIDATGRQLNTVFEFEPLDPGQIPDDQLASPDLPPISSPLLRPSTGGSSKVSAFRDFPSAPRLLPVQISMPPSPFTPLAIDHRGELREARGLMGAPLSSNGDYLSAGALHSAPRGPKLVPTMLSLPPSPWTPYQDSSTAHTHPMIHLHLNTSNSSLRLPPGTPRLIPTHIEILPSPFRLQPRLDEARSRMTVHKACVHLEFRDRLWPDRRPSSPHLQHCGSRK